MKSCQLLTAAALNFLLVLCLAKSAFLQDAQPTPTPTPKPTPTPVPPSVTPIPVNLNVQAVRLQSPVSRVLTGWMLPSSLKSSQPPIVLDSRTQGVELEGADVILLGDKTSTFLTDASGVTLDVPKVLKPGINPVSLKVQDASLSPDRYAGSLRFRFAGIPQPVIVPAVLEVRNGPLWPLIIIILGVLFGRLVQKSESPEMQKQFRLLRRYFLLRDDIEDLKDDTVRQVFLQRLEGVRRRIEHNTDSEEMITQELVQLEMEVQRENGMAAGFRAEALQKEKEAQGKLAQARSNPLIRGLHAFIGSEIVSAETFYLWVRPFLLLALLVLLCLIGFHSLYIVNGATFGSGGFYDYFGLFLWGLSADVAQKRLQDLQLSK